MPSPVPAGLQSLISFPLVFPQQYRLDHAYLMQVYPLGLSRDQQTKLDSAFANLTRFLTSSLSVYRVLHNTTQQNTTPRLFPLVHSESDNHGPAEHYHRHLRL